MKKSLVTGWVVLFGFVVWMGYSFTREIPSGAFSKTLLKKTWLACTRSSSFHACQFDVSLEKLQSDLPFQWDEVYVFPNGLGAGDYGATILNPDRDFLNAISVVFVASGKPAYEEYNEMIVEGFIEWRALKYAIHYADTKDGFYKCSKQAYLTIIYQKEIHATPAGCEVIQSSSGQEEDRLVRHWKEFVLKQ